MFPFGSTGVWKVVPFSSTLSLSCIGLSFFLSFGEQGGTGSVVERRTTKRWTFTSLSLARRRSSVRNPSCRTRRAYKINRKGFRAREITFRSTSPARPSSLFLNPLSCEACGRKGSLGERDVHACARKATTYERISNAQEIAFLRTPTRFSSTSHARVRSKISKCVRIDTISIPFSCSIRDRCSSSTSFGFDLH